MKIIDATNLDYRAVNEALRKTSSDCTVEGCCSQRFIAAGMSGKNITLKSNAQDAIGDTMNEGKILIHGNLGDAAGYAMRGGKIYIQGSAGYRAGIRKYPSGYCAGFGYSVEKRLSAPFTVIAPDSNNLYKQMYIAS